MGSAYRVTGTDFSQLTREAVRGRMARWAMTLATLETERVKFVFRATPMNLEEPVRRARRAEAAAQGPRQISHIKEYIALLHRATQGDLMGFEHYLVLPELGGINAEAQANALMQGIGIRGRPVADLPRLLPVSYRECGGYLEPVRGNYPLLSVLTSYDVTGTWDWTVLNNLLTVGFPIAISVEFTNYPGAKAIQMLDKQKTAMDGVAAQVGQKMALQKRAQDLAALLNYVQQGEALHEMAVGVLVQGRTEDQLKNREQEIIARGAGHIALQRYNGLQKQIFKAFFTSAEKPEPISELKRNITSTGAATAMGPLGIRRRSDTNGIFWGFSQQDPFFWDGFGPQLNQPNHWIWFGTTGSGKTGSSSAILLRELNFMDSQVIMLDPLGNCVNLVNELGEERASYNPLSMDSLRINPVEMIHANDAEQSAHLTVILQMLMGRELSEAESIAVDRVVPMIYEGITPDIPPSNQPRLEQLCRVLQFGLSGAESVVQAGNELGNLMHDRYVMGTLAKNFNVATQADWRLTRDLVAFDFRGVPDEENRRQLAYYLVLSVIQRWAYKHKRERRRILWIDEFARLSAEPMLAGQVAMMYKTFRTLGVGVWALEQDLVTFVGLDQMSGSSQVDIASGLQILSNATGVVALAHLPAGAKVLPERYPQLTQDHVQFIQALNPKQDPNDLGRGLILLGDSVFPIKVQLTSHELQALGGS